ncbi:tyrosine-type recombinase/integrase [Rhodovulum sp. DZ06]|uniref:tyrosine-type recombinase/integrase n=1 Tax=Rhodovulum sp. DZ06 TaxID=3425126 RepID=UPI003D325CE6
MKLTEKRVRDARPGPGTQIVWDETAKGLGLRITQKGVKSYVVEYRIDDLKRRATLGRADALSLAEARDRALAWKQQAREGADPLAETRARKAAPRMDEALDRFLNEYIPRRLALGKMAPSTAAEYRRQIERHLRPALGRMKVRDVTARDIAAMLADAPLPERTGKKKAGRGPLAPVAANRVTSLCSRVFRLCEDWEWRPQHSNPARSIEKAREEPRDRTFSDRELGALGAALTRNGANEEAILAIRLAALTGLRIGEIVGMRWEDLDLDAGLLTLPRTKTGRRIHSLPAAAVELLRDARRIGAHVIAGRERDRPLNMRTVRDAFVNAVETAGLRDARIHDLRRTVMTRAAASGASAHLLRDMVGHKTTAMADRYIRNAGEPLLELRERIGGEMAAQVMGGMKEE